MSNEKIRHWVYTALGFLILFGIGWYLLMRPSQVTKDSLADIYSQHRQAFENVSAYLLSKEVSADITALPSVDNHFGVPGEDSQEYENYNSGMFELMETEVASVKSTGNAVQFKLKKHGGFLVQEYGVLAVGEAPISLSGSPRDTLNGTWYYYIMKED